MSRAGWSIVLGLVLVTRVVGAEPAPLDATARCFPAAGPGRVRCEASVRAPQGSRVAWADLVILEAPAGVSLLKARVPPSDATEPRDDGWRWAFAVVARSHGKGELRARVRAVICVQDACSARVAEVAAIVSAGE